MEEPRKILEGEVAELEKIEKIAREELKKSPQGALRIARNKNTDQYYWRMDPKDKKGTYISKKEEKLIKGLAQKDYAQKVLEVIAPIIKKKKKDLQAFEKMNAQKRVLEVGETLSSARQKLITPYVLDDDEFAVKWECEKKMLKEKVGQVGKFPEVCTEIYTEKGECVRSKSEKILADKLYMMNIPYIYESPLHLKGYGYIKPDFTVLNKQTRKEYYWEHLGMMDEKEYCEKAIKKIESLEQNGIFPGKNLILTYETKEHPLNMKIVEKLIEEYLT